MVKQSKISWKTETRTINELIQSEINPRKISKEQKEALQRSLEQFNLADIPVINKDNTIISGNQRLRILAELGRGDEKIDVRVPNRELTETELKQYMLIANTHAGVFDVELLEAEFEGINIDFEIVLKEEEQNVDYSFLDDKKDEISRMRENVRKAIQIEFHEEDFENAQKLVKAAREKKLYIGNLLIETLKRLL